MGNRDYYLLHLINTLYFFAAVFRFVTQEERCVAILKTAAKETTVKFRK